MTINCAGTFEIGMIHETGVKLQCTLLGASSRMRTGMRVVAYGGLEVIVSDE